MQDVQSDRSSVMAVLLDKGGRFFVYEPGLAVIASGDSVEGAYANFLRTRRGYADEIQRAGLPALKLAPTTAPGGRTVGMELLLFLAKTLIVFLVISALGLVATLSAKQYADRLNSTMAQSIENLTATVGRSVESFSAISMADVVNKVAVISQDVQSLPEERKEALRRSIGVIAREVVPIVDAWRDTALGSETKPPSEVDKSR